MKWYSFWRVWIIVWIGILYFGSLSKLILNKRESKAWGRDSTFKG
jgi:hypothetical protein